MNGILILLGTNLGERCDNLETAIQELTKKQISVVEKSAIYESQPWGISEQPWFYNMVLEVETNHSPTELLEVCLGVETKMGRVRKLKWGERLIDIDILYYNNEVIENDHLKVPHPGIPDRRFTLFPLVEKWSGMLHPILNRTQKELLSVVEDELIVRKTDVVLGNDLD